MKKLEGETVTRAWRNDQLWLTATYMGLIWLMIQAQA